MQELQIEPQEPTTAEIRSFDLLGNRIEDSVDPVAFEELLTDELRQLMLAAANISELLKTAKTSTKRDYYKKKIKKMQTKAKQLLYAQYLYGKKTPTIL